MSDTEIVAVSTAIYAVVSAWKIVNLERRVRWLGEDVRGYHAGSSCAREAERMLPMNPIKELEDAIAKCDALPVSDAYLDAVAELGELFIRHHSAVMAVLRAAVEWRSWCGGLSGNFTGAETLRGAVERLLAGGEEEAQPS